MTNNIWIVCPCYFDVDSFLKLHQETGQALTQQSLAGHKAQFIVVDDSAGADSQIAELQSLPDVTIVTTPYNMGHQAALVFALRRLGNQIQPSDLVVTMDSDGEDNPQDIPSLVAPLLSDSDNRFKIALARRTHRTETLAFKLMYFIFKVAFLILTGTIIRNGNFVAFRGTWLKEMIFHPHFDQCYSSTFISLPLHSWMVPLARGKRYFGKSKMGYFGLITHGMRMFMPFTERIAIRGTVFSLFCMFTSGIALFWVPLHLRVIAMLAFVISILSLGIFGLLFSTFSQTKSRSLRGLYDLKSN